MTSGPAPSGPRLVYDAGTAKSGAPTPAPTEPARRGSSGRRWWILALVALALLAAFQWQRAAALETRVGELTASLATARAEIAARNEQLRAIRSSVDDLRDRVAGLATLAAEEPTAPSVSPSEGAPAQ